MIFDKTTIFDCLIQPPIPPDGRCADSQFALQNPALCQNSALILKPAVALLCVLDSLQLRLFEFINGVETEITTGVAFTSSDADVFVVGVNSGSGTALTAGEVTITATYGGRTAETILTVLGEACCNDIQAVSAIVVDNSRSMSLQSGWRLAFAKAMAIEYGGTIISVGDVPKDSVQVWSISSTLTPLLAASQDTAAITAAINGITQTQNKTSLLEVFTVAADGLLDVTADRRILVLFSDCEEILGDRQAVLDAAFAFKQAGGIVIVVAARASGQGFDLAERIATAGFFINGLGAGANVVPIIKAIHYLKSLLCIGVCIDAGDRFENAPTLDYSSFLNWEVVEGKVNLLGPGLMDFLPGNGLYVELVAEAHAMIRTIDTFALQSGDVYHLSFRAAGNQVSQSASQSISVSVRAANGTKLFEQTVYPAWNDTFQTYNLSFTAPYDETVRVYFEQNYAGDLVPGTLLDEIHFSNDTDGIELLFDSFDDENITYIPPACGGSSAIDPLDNPEAPTVDWLGDYSDNLTLYHKFTYGISWVTNEGETAVSDFVTFARTESEAHEQTLRRINFPLPTPEGVTAIRVWRDLGGEIDVDPDGTTLYLLAEVPATQQTYLDNESIGAFQARYEPSVTAPTENTTGSTTGAMGYGYAPCCYYSSSTSETDDLIAAGDSDSNPSVTATGVTLDGVSADAYLAIDGDTGTSWDGATGGGTDAVWTCEFPTAKLISSYQITAETEGVSPPTNFILEGSNNGSTWVTIDTQSVATDQWEHLVAKLFNVSPVEAYKSFRFTFDAESAEVLIAEFQLIGAAQETVFINNCPPCSIEIPGAQVSDPSPLPNIEAGETPVIYNSTKQVCVSCATGLTNLSDTNLVPVMTSATAPSGEVSASEEYDAEHAAWKAADGDDSTFWEVIATALPVIWKCEYAAATIVAHYSIFPWVRGAPESWTFEGSLDGTTWVVLDTRANITAWIGYAKRFMSSNATAYLSYRLNVSDAVFIADEAAYVFGIHTLEMFADAPAQQCASASAQNADPLVAEEQAKAAATAAAQALLNCAPIYTATRTHRATCPYNQFGAEITKSSTKQSLNSAAEAEAAAQADAEAQANAELDCTQSNNEQSITINDNTKASPYPSIKYVSGLDGVIAKVTITLCGLTHPSPDDLQILLVSPSGTKVKVWQNAGGANAMSNITVILDSTAGTPLPDSTAVAAGTYRPACYSPGTALQMESPAPTAPYLTTLDAFIGEDPTGSWAIWISDDLTVYSGQLGCGWDLAITMEIPT